MKTSITIIPTQSYLTISMHNVSDDESRIVLPDGASNPSSVPYGIVLAVGPDVKTLVAGDKVLFLPGNLMAGFNQGEDSECFLIPEAAVFGKLG